MSEVDATAANSLAFRVTRSLSVMILIVEDKALLILYDEGFQLGDLGV